nr:MAG: RNA-dependent RNA polymerase [Permutotetraviridae sp.]
MSYEKRFSAPENPLEALKSKGEKKTDISDVGDKIRPLPPISKMPPKCNDAQAKQIVQPCKYLVPQKSIRVPPEFQTGPVVEDKLLTVVHNFGVGKWCRYGNAALQMVVAPSNVRKVPEEDVAKARSFVDKVFQTATTTVACGGTLQGLLNRIVTGMKNNKGILRCSQLYDDDDILTLQVVLPLDLEKIKMPHGSNDGQGKTLADQTVGTANVKLNLDSAAGGPMVGTKRDNLPRLLEIANEIFGVFSKFGTKGMLDYLNKNPSYGISKVINKFDYYSLDTITTKTRPFNIVFGALIWLFSIPMQVLQASLNNFLQDPSSRSAYRFSFAHGGAHQLMEYMTDPNGPALRYVVYGDDVFGRIKLDDGTFLFFDPDASALDLSMSPVVAPLFDKVWTSQCKQYFGGTWSQIMNFAVMHGFNSDVLLFGATVYRKTSSWGSGESGTSVVDILWTTSAYESIFNKPRYTDDQLDSILDSAREEGKYDPSKVPNVEAKDGGSNELISEGMTLNEAKNALKYGFQRMREVFGISIKVEEINYTHFVPGETKVVNTRFLGNSFYMGSVPDETGQGKKSVWLARPDVEKLALALIRPRNVNNSVKGLARNNFELDHLLGLAVVLGQANVVPPDQDLDGQKYPYANAVLYQAIYNSYSTMVKAGAVNTKDFEGTDNDPMYMGEFGENRKFVLDTIGKIIKSTGNLPTREFLGSFMWPDEYGEPFRRQTIAANDSIAVEKVTTGLDILAQYVYEDEDVPEQTESSNWADITENEQAREEAKTRNKQKEEKLSELEQLLVVSMPQAKDSDAVNILNKTPQYTPSNQLGKVPPNISRRQEKAAKYKQRQAQQQKHRVERASRRRENRKHKDNNGESVRTGGGRVVTEKNEMGEEVTTIYNPRGYKSGSSAETSHSSSSSSSYSSSSSSSSSLSSSYSSVTGWFKKNFWS